MGCEMYYFFKSIFKKWIGLFSVIITFISFLLLIITFFWHPGFLMSLPRLPGNISALTEIQDEYTWVYYFLISTLTALIFYVAQTQLSNLNTHAEDDFLIRIGERFESNEKTLGGVYIHEICLELGVNDINRKYHKVGEKIIDLSKKKDESKKFIYILHVLDFMETMGYLYLKDGGLSREDIKKLFKVSVIKNYAIFKPYIDHVRKVDEKLYRNFQDMYNELNKPSPSD
jgi:hypothetical protein